MTWLSRNYQWIFSGIGVLIVSLFFELWRRSSQKPSSRTAKASLKAQGSVAGSPVASGDHFKQEVNAPVIQHADNVHIGPSTAPTPRMLRDKDKAPVKTEEPTHNLAFCYSEIMEIAEMPGGIFVPREHVLPAALLKFSNDAVEGAMTNPVTVKATVMYREGAVERLRVVGNWLEHGSGNIQFGVDESHKLIVAFVLNKELYTSHRREVYAHRKRWWTPELHRFGTASTLNVLVRLTAKFTGYCYFEGEFEISKEPLKISAVKNA